MSETCICPKQCDCLAPEVDGGAALASNHCPVHNLKPRPLDECPIHVPKENPRKVPTKEQWDAAEKELSGYFGRVEMVIDGFKVSFLRGRVSKNRLGIMTYVNDVFKHTWCSAKEPSEEARRFFSTSTRTSSLRGKAKAAFAKKYGKRAANKPLFTFSYPNPVWGSFKALRLHLLKHNRDIEIVEGKGQGDGDPL